MARSCSFIYDNSFLSAEHNGAKTDLRCRQLWYIIISADIYTLAYNVMQHRGLGVDGMKILVSSLGQPDMVSSFELFAENDPPSRY